MALDVLVLGGTGFIGRAVVDRLLAGGHRPALFNRGRDRSLFPGVERLIGDREAGDYAALRYGTWDAVVDLTGYYPRQVEAAAAALDDRAGRYVFISSHAVFDGAGPALRPPIWDAEELTNDTYGPSKVACERWLTERYGGRATVVRPCKVAGPHDNQEGLTYWVRQAAGGGPVTLPGDPAQPIQLVDVRDVAGLIVRLIAEERGGAFTAAGEQTDFAGLIATCAAAAGTTVEVVPVPPVPGSSLPLIRPREVWDTLHRTPAAEMTVTPLSVTARDVLAWDQGRAAPEVRP